MTLGIAVCLEDGAILIADGRRVKPFVNHEKISDNTNKITRITETVASISFGETHATDWALSILKKANNGASNSLAEIMSKVEEAVKIGWNTLLVKLESNVDKKSLRAALLVGGYLSKQSKGGFIGGALFRLDGHDPPTVKNDRFDYILLGGEEYGSQEIFKQIVEDEVRKVSESGSTSQNDYIDAILRSGASTIRQIEQKSPDVGGEIRYAILRRGLDYIENTLNS